jgi:hypothetical protein
LPRLQSLLQNEFVSASAKGAFCEVIQLLQEDRCLLGGRNILYLIEVRPARLKVKG